MPGTAVGVLVLYISYCAQAKLHVGFTELDYYESEDEDCLQVMVSRNGTLNEDVVVGIHPLTYQRFRENSFTLPNVHPFDTLPPPAEDGRDYKSDVKRITLHSGSHAEEHDVCIDIIHDSVRETDEGFLLVLSIDESIDDHRTSSEVFHSFGSRRVALGIIMDDDYVHSCTGLDRRSVCHSKAICHDELEGGVLCECMDGYQGDGITSCTDIDECEERLDDCSQDIQCSGVSSSGREMCGPVASCVNTDGSYQCTCSNGYIGDGRICTAIERAITECSEGTHNCHPNAHCEDTPDGFHCHCKHGYEGNGTKCTDVDECATDGHDCDRTKFCHYSLVKSKVECTHTAYCTNTQGGYMCSCSTGFTGDGVICDDIDECESETICDVNAHCRNIPGSYHCNCNEGFQKDGQVCTDINECEVASRVECGPNAVCENTLGSFQCVCDDGYKRDGVNCTKVPIDECTLGIYDCVSKSHCVDDEHGYSCVCDSGYTRDDSDQCIDRDECLEAIAECSDNADCQNTEGYYECYCHSGYEGDGFTCEDIDECSEELDSCSSLADCSNTVGSYECQCRPGYQGDGRVCSDVDECILQIYDCTLNSECVNTEGSFECICRTGFQRNGSKCIDINECLVPSSVECGPNAVCENTPSSFKCVCKDGYQGNGTTCSKILVDECALEIHDCLSNSHCVNEDNGYSCVCDHGYTKDAALDRCIDIDECRQSLHDCSIHAECTNTIGGHRCMCKRGYFGSGTKCLPLILFDLCDKGEGFLQWIACQKIYQLFTEPDGDGLSLFNSLPNGEWTPKERGHYSNERQDDDQGATGINHREDKYAQTQKHQFYDGEKTNKFLATDRYPDMLDLWSEKVQGKSVDSKTVTAGSLQHLHSHAHRHKVAIQSSSRHPSARRPKAKNVAHLQNKGRPHSLRGYGAEKDDEDVWFMVPGNVDVKIAEW